MTTLLGIADFVVIGCILVVSASIGIYFRFTGGRQKTTQEFLMAGKNMHVGPVAFSLMATYMSAISLLGVPAETYLYGTQNLFWIVGLPFGAIIAAYAFLPVFFEMNVSTAYEYLERRFGKTTRTIASLLFTLQMVLYMAVVLYAPSLALNAVTGLSTWTSVIVLAVVCTFYCSLGGLKAVLWTDVFQSFLMYFTIISLAVAAVMRLGLKRVIDTADQGGRFIFTNLSTDLTERYTLWNCFLAGFLFSINTYGSNQAQVQRMMSIGNLKRAQIALFWSIPLTILYNVFNYIDGVVIYSMFHDCDPMEDPATQLSSADQLLPFALVKLFGGSPGLAGLAIAGVFSASLSTISSAVNSLTAVTIEDYIRPYCTCTSLTESRAAVLAKLLGVVYCVITLLLTYLASNFRAVVEASNILFGMVGGPVLGIFLLGMFSKTANEKGSLTGLLVGFSVNAWLGFGSYAAQPPLHPLPQSIAGCSSILNTTLSNASVILNMDALALLDTAAEEERYIFPPYKMSFMWFSVIGCLTVVIVGYVTSFLLSFWLNVPEVDRRSLSPLVRRFLVKSEKEKKNNNVASIYPEMEMNTKNPNEIQGIWNVVVRDS